MYYVCIENNKVINILGYEPSVPSTVSLVTITAEQNKQIMDQTHVFDIASNRVVPVADSIAAQKAQDLINAQERDFLNSTDWKVLRHIRQQVLGIPTSLSAEEYRDLEYERESAASRIV